MESQGTFLAEDGHEVSYKFSEEDGKKKYTFYVEGEMQVEVSVDEAEKFDQMKHPSIEPYVDPHGDYVVFCIDTVAKTLGPKAIRVAQETPENLYALVLTARKEHLELTSRVDEKR